MIIWITTAIGLGLIAAAIAHTKGRSSWRWGVYGTLFGIVSVPYLLLSRDLGDERNWQPDRFGLPGRGGACPHCGARVDADAVICRRCRKNLADHPTDRAPAAGNAKPSHNAASVSLEDASRDPMFRRLDDAFASLTVGKRAAARQSDGEAASLWGERMDTSWPSPADAPEKDSVGGDPGTEDKWRYVHFSPINPNRGPGAAGSRRQADGVEATGREGGESPTDRLVAEKSAWGGWSSLARRWLSGGAWLPWNRRIAGVSALGALSVVAIVLAVHAVPWFSRLSPPEAPLAMEDSGLTTASDGEDTAVDPISAEPQAAPVSRTAPPAAGPNVPTALMAPPPPKPTPPARTTEKPTAAAPMAVAIREAQEPDTLIPPSSSDGGPGRDSATPKKKGTSLATDDFAGTVKKALADRRRHPKATHRQPKSDGGDGISAAGEIVALVQQRLRERGYDPGVVDGRAGPRTRAAIQAFQRNLGQKADGQINTALLQHLGIVGQKIRAFRNEGVPTASR